MEKIKTVGYKMMFSSTLSKDEIEEAISLFLRDVSIGVISQVSEMSEEELAKFIGEV